MEETVHEPRSEKEWLSFRGGRTAGDVLVDEIGKYIFLWDGRAKKNVKAYIPSFNSTKDGDKKGDKV